MSRPSRYFRLPNPPREPARARLALESLEDRTVPAPFLVTNLDDTGTGSLRDAIAQANALGGLDTISFQAGLSGTITLTTGELDITDPVQINGPGAGAIVVSGNNTSRIFGIDNGAAGFIDVTIGGLTLTGGNAGTGDGGAIKVADEHLTLTGVILTSNSASRGGAVYTQGQLAVAASTFGGNHATGTGANAGGGAIFLDTNQACSIVDSVIADNQSTSTGEGGGGIGVAAGGNLTIERTTISSNRALGPFANGGGVSFVNNGSLTIRTSTLSGNSAEGSGGGIFADSAGTTIENSTISSNSARFDGGGIDLNAGTLVLRNSTVAFNVADSDNFGGGNGGGIFVGTAGVTLQSTIVSNNLFGATGGISPDISGPVTATVSLVKDITGTILLGGSSGNITGVDPLLGGLANNGGPTPTHALAAGSIAIDHGANFAGTAFDQRGAPFARLVGPAVDIGAFELQTSEGGGGGGGGGGGLQEPTAQAIQVAAQIVQTLQRGGTKLLAFAFGETNGDNFKDIVLAFRLRNGRLLIATLSGVNGGVLGAFQPFPRPMAIGARVQLVLLNLDANPPLDIGVVINGGGPGIPRVSAFTITGARLL
jgi:parallel beta-helix repeat protein